MNSKMKFATLLLMSFPLLTTSVWAQQDDESEHRLLNKEIKRDPARRLDVDSTLRANNNAEFDDDARQSFIFTEGQLNESEDVIQSSTAMITSNDDYFLSEVGYLFSPMRFRIRAFENQYNNVYANSVLLNDAERGTFSYGMIGGLNDATRNKEGGTYFEGLGFGYSSIGGASNINMRASQYAAGHKASIVGCNRNYLARLMYTYSTGLMKNGWAVTASASYRWANEGVIEGTFYNSLAYYLAVEKVINDNHSISIATWGSPTERAQQAAATEEAYWLANSHYYNSNWGYQNGEKRNARVVNSYEPTAIVTWDWKINRNTKLTTSLVGKYSMYSTTALGWNGNAADPRPNYYKNLPSAAYDVWDLNYTPTEDEVAAWKESYDFWKESKANRQLNWDYMYFANQQANAVGGECLYYVERRHNDQAMLGIGSVLNHEFDRFNKIAVGVNLGTTKGMHYKTMSDLMGANKYTDIDKFSVGDVGLNSIVIQNDVDNPNRDIKEDDVFGYDYDIYVNRATAFANYQFNKDGFHLYAGANIEGTTMERYGNMRNGRAINNSKGSSGTAKFLGGGVKAAAAWEINGNNTISYGIGYEERAPLAYNSFVAPRMRNDFVTGLTTEGVFNQELSYRFSFGPVSGKITGYYTMFNDAVEQTAFYNDSEAQFTNLSMTGIDKRHYGIEGAIVYNVNSALSFNFLASVGDAEYTNDVNGFLISENEKVVKNDKVYMDGVKVNSTPLTALSLGVDYNTNGWYLSASVNYFDRVYVDASSYARLSEVVGAPIINENGEKVLDIPSQYKGKGGFMVDASIGKSIRLNGGKQLNLNLSLNNILNNTDMITGGYEQNRGDTYQDGSARVYKFSKNPFLYYANAFNAYLNIGFRF